ncbi:MAG TPA: uroporphyrinogen-III synthase [Puia sp.]|nr:uroporphyrinogen-III synthase [Puia sp.]
MSASIAYVLSTRALPAALIEEAATKGITIDAVPFIATAKLQDDTLTKRLADLVDRPLTAIFTSTNAVTAIEKAMSPGWKIFCLNGATRRAAAERFGENAIAGTADSAAELAEVIISRGSFGESETRDECWFFCGDKRRDELPDRLNAAGWQVHEVVVYQTILTPQRIDKTYDVIVFFSPSAVESFFSMNTMGPQVRLFAIGRTTAAAIRAKCPNPVSMSEKPDEQILIRQILERLDAARPKDKH